MSRITLATHKRDAIKLLCIQVLVGRALLVDPSPTGATADLSELILYVVVTTGATHGLVRGRLDLFRGHIDVEKTVEVARLVAYSTISCLRKRLLGNAA